MDKILDGENNNDKILHAHERKSLTNSLSDTSLSKCDAENKNASLKLRIESLQRLMGKLRRELEREKSKWKQEVEEANNISYLSPLSYEDCESKYSDETSIISSYEKKLLEYQEALQQARVEKKSCLQRQIAISNYKRRLLEVENMCNLELLRVKQSVQFLQPLKSIISEWNCEGDNKMSCDMSMKQLPKEVEMPLELLGNDFQSSDNFISKTFPNSSMPQLTSSATIWQTDDSCVTHSQSTIWYSECQTKFNAY